MTTPTPPQASTILSSALQHGIRPGLERVSALLEKLGRPQDRLKVVHVAGTNGKGSVCALMSAVLRAAGYKVGRYTSPHLISYRERMWCDGAFIEASEFDALLAMVEKTASTLDPTLGPITEFELLTASAFHWFASQSLDLLLLEVGLGGRLDATNVVDQPEVSVITRIARDHTALLGDTLEAIAGEKAGILKPGVTAVTGAQGVALSTIETIATSVGSPVTRAPEARWLGPGAEGDRVQIADRSFEIGLLGAYQAQNAAIALGTIVRLRERGWAIPDEALVQGFSAARWPGRLDRWHASTQERYIFDGAHNLDGIHALAQALTDRPEPTGRVIVLGVLADKHPAEMLAAIAPLADTLILTSPPSPRALDPAEWGQDLAHPDLHRCADWKEALALARSISHGREVVIAGSLYLVGAAYEALNRPIDA